MWPAFPASDYYDPSAPFQWHQLATSLPAGLPEEVDRGGVTGRVPAFTVVPFDRGGAQLCPCGIATATPQAFTVASLSATSTDVGVSGTILCAGVHRIPAHIRQV